MKRKHSERLEGARGELSETLYWIEAADNLAAAEEARTRLIQLSMELRERYELKAPPEDPQSREFFCLCHEKAFSGAGKLEPRHWHYFENPHFTLIRDVGDKVAGHIRWLLKESGIGRDPNLEKGILKAPLCVIKHSVRDVKCPEDLIEVALGDLRGLKFSDVENRFEVTGKDQPFVEAMFRQLDKAVATSLQSPSALPCTPATPSGSRRSRPSAGGSRGSR